MNLNKYHRKAFVRSVLDDLPHVDYDEQARKLCIPVLEEKLPKKLRGLYKEFASFFDTSNVETPGCLAVIYYPREGASSMLRESPVWEKLEELSALKKAQNSLRYSLESKLTTAIESCRTLKQATEQLPEFIKYLPQEANTGTANLPVANLVADLVSAGWPKDSKKGAAR